MADLVLDPLVWLAVLLMMCVLMGLVRRCYRCAFMSFLSLGLLSLIASPGFANKWLGTLENEFPLRQCAMESNDDIIVVLGGGLNGGYTEFSGEQRLSDPSKNRALAAAEIVKEDGIMFFAGGKAASDTVVPEAQAMASMVETMLPRGVTVAIEVDSTDTYQNAINVQSIIGQMGAKKEIVLVTSAVHMPRAQRVFAALGFEVCTYAVDPLLHKGVPLTTLWPQVTALNKTKRSLHEWVGRYYYQFKGYI